MKILLVCQYFHPENFRVNELAFGLRDRGHSVTVLTGLPNYPTGRIFPGYFKLSALREHLQGVTILRTPLIPRFQGRGWQLALNYLSFAFFASVLGPFRCTGKFDVIFVYQLSPVTMAVPGIVIKWLKRTKLVLYVQDLWPESLSATGSIRSPRILRWVRALVRWVYRSSDLILVQSQAFVPLVRENCGTEKRIEYFPTQAESFYRPVERRESRLQELGLSESAFRVCFAGNIGAAQDFETILEAIERLKAHPIQWLILGEGRMRKWLQSEVAARGLDGRVFLLGAFPPVDMPGFFALSHAMLVTLRPDPAFDQTLPMKVQSYLACAKPIVAALAGEGERVILEAGAGFVAPPGNPAELAEAVLKMSRLSIEQQRAMGERGHRYYLQNFESQMLISRLEGLLLETCSH
jgi:colanic acid biosynthesis glycosyl transferase WcaI